jgi:hypothetical protein
MKAESSIIVTQLAWFSVCAVVYLIYILGRKCVIVISDVCAPAPQTNQKIIFSSELQLSICNPSFLTLHGLPS